MLSHADSAGPEAISLRDRVAIVTGASRGLGAAFMHGGWSVAELDRSMAFALGVELATEDRASPMTDSR